MPGRLILCATPIGNLGDASPRLRETLAAADVIFAEDTRRARTLLTALGVDRPTRSFFAGNEEQRHPELASRLAAGETVALITDAGTPSVSDPGVSAVAVARSGDAAISVIPGPSAVTAALTWSGFPAERFVFEGFLPRKGRARVLAALAREGRTIVLFASPHRLLEDLDALAGALGSERAVCVTREITKKFEEAWWGTLAEARAEWSRREPRGEFTLVVAGADPAPMGVDQAVAEARRMMAEGSSRSEAARRAAAEGGLRKAEVYDRL